MTALENVATPMELAGVRDCAPQARAALEAVGLAHRMGHYPAQLSGGEQQRVAIARALAPRPALVFADEPTGNLDHANGEAVADLLFAAVAGARATLLMVTHDEALAARCGRIVRLGAAAEEIINRHAYPEPVANLLGEACALASEGEHDVLGLGQAFLEGMIVAARVFKAWTEAQLVEARGNLVVLLVGRRGLNGDRQLRQLSDQPHPVCPLCLDIPVGLLFGQSLPQQSADTESDHRIGEHIGLQQTVQKIGSRILWRR
jgi:energy-coupling factor transporter ATP-binding protein EcfA2